ncbi:MAG: PA2779 family protein [Pseudomonadota bacterium]|uniref:PA2779 family protein n=1 Tax=Thermithiobacillus tepidarius TaxID=929 RepID=UPI0003F4E3CF|nr:PA2779 family protein [Thermithiobacillus tepidarius]
MHIMPRLAKPISTLLIAATLGLSLPVSPAQASMVGTDSVINQYTNSADRERVRNFLERQDVQAELERQGVKPTEALARVDALSDAEVSKIAGKLDMLPAGGDGVGAVVGALILIFVVLLITDILGLTHVFPFVYHRR